MLSKLCQFAKSYVQNMEISDIAAFKLCLFSLGTLAGLALPKKMKQMACLIASLTFLFTYIPLMVKLVQPLVSRED